MLSNLLSTPELIKKLKEIKEKQHLSPQRIAEMVDAAGYSVSLSSIRKVFSDGSENENFRFHDTLQPISRVLLGIYGDEHGDLEVDGLRAAIHVKDEAIDRLERELAEVQADARRRIDYLKKQNELKDQNIDRLMSRVDVLVEQIQKLIDKL